MRKRLLPLILSLILLMSMCITAAALGTSATGYVTDETGVLSDATYSAVDEANEKIESIGGQIFVVFINYFGDMYSDEYAMRLFNEWKISDLGMLLVVSPNEGRGGIAVGSELTDVFTDKDINNYLDRYFWDSFDKGSYDKAVTTLIDKLIDWYDSNFDLGLKPSGGSGGLAALGFFGVILGFLFRNILIIIIFVILIAAVIASDRRRYRSYHSYMGIPMPRYHFWYMFSPRPYRRWRMPPSYGPSPRARNDFSGYSRPSSRSNSVRRSGGTFGGRSGRSSSGGGFRGGFGGRSGGGFGGRR